MERGLQCDAKLFGPKTESKRADLTVHADLTIPHSVPSNESGLFSDSGLNLLRFFSANSTAAFGFM